jgi:hypothetical protein
MLIADLKSYSSIEDVRGMIGAKGWHVLDEPRPTVNDARPRFDHVTVDARANYCGQAGVLRLQFINELLVSTMFTPPNLDECMKQLANGGAFTTSGTDDGSRYFWLGRSLENKPFVGIMDSRLQREIDAWIRRYDP